MPGPTSPFIEKEVKCPVCNKGYPQRFFRQRMFVAESKESDQHVVVYKWLSESTKPVHPPFYHFFFCPECYYTDVTEEFVNAGKSDTALRVLRAFKNIGDEERVVLELLAHHVNYDTIDFESALNLHFLAILAQTLPPEDMRDAYKIARLLLRAAWLYREHIPGGPGDDKPAELDEMTQAIGAFQAALLEAKEQWARVSRMAQDRMHRIDEALYAKCKDHFEKIFAAQFSEFVRLKLACKRAVKGAALDGASANLRLASTFRTYEEFFEELKTRWPLAPADEIEAMRNAISYFHRALASDPRLDSPRAYGSVVTVVADLMVRCDDLDGAFSMVRSIYKSNSDARLQCQQTLRRKDVDEATRKRLQVQIRRIGDSLQHAAELRRQLIDRLIERDMPMIKQSIQEN